VKKKISLMSGRHCAHQIKRLVGRTQQKASKRNTLVDKSLFLDTLDEMAYM
jgi:hypothetical protein